MKYNMTVDEAWPYLGQFQVYIGNLNLLSDVGLSYIKLGQSATTLSGGKHSELNLQKNYLEDRRVLHYIF